MAPICTSGYGVVSLEILRALRGLGHSVSLFPIGQIECSQQDGQLISEALQSAKKWDPWAPSLRIYHQFSLAEHVLTRGPRVAFPIFELDRFTEQEMHHLNQQDLVLVASKWAKGVLETNGVAPPVFVVPFGVNPSVFYSTPLPSCEETVFLHCAKLEYRKGVYDILEAFGEAFQPNASVRLILHVHNPFARPEVMRPVWDEFLQLIQFHPLAQKIQLTQGRFQSQQEVAQLMAGAYCGLFPSRAEGWNLELSEMLAMGRHCIATEYSGHTEFISPDYCRMIEVDELETAYDGIYFFGQGKWAKLGDRQRRQLVEHMQIVHVEREMGRLELNKPGVQAMSQFTWERTAAKLVEALQWKC